MEGHQAAAVSGAIAIVTMTIAVIALVPLEGAYHLDGLDRWVASSHDEPEATTLSAWMFAIGLLASVGLYAGIVAYAPSRDRGTWAVGAALLGSAAILDAAASLGPFISLLAVGDLGAAIGLSRSLFVAALAVDALHNLMIGVAFLIWWKPFTHLEPSPLWRGAHVIAGAGMFIAGSQAFIPDAAIAVIIAGWVWLAWLGRMSWKLWHGALSASAIAEDADDGAAAAP